MAIFSSASLREQIPELAMYLFKRISSGFDAVFGFDFFLKGALPLAKLLDLLLACPLPEVFPFPLLS